MLEIASVVVFHAGNVGGKDTAKHVVHNISIVTGATCLCGIEDRRLDTLLVVLAEDASCVTYQPK